MSQIRIAHLSDPHFGQLNPAAETALVSFLKERKPDLVLISGDITQRARRRQFEDARKFHEKLAPMTTFAVPGNHDIPLFNLPARLFMPYSGFHRYFQVRREAQFYLPGISITGLNSTSRWRHVQGALSLNRIRPALERIDRNTKIRVVTMHHPMACAKGIDRKNLLKNRDEVAAVLSETSIDLILSGHIHDPYVELTKVRYPKVKRSMIVAVAGTCLSSRTRAGAPNSFNWIEIDAVTFDRISLTRMDLALDGFFHPIAAPKQFTKENDGWIQIPTKDLN